tara:strand:- start:892 stop:1719 length:828 start_codon:yes stop_codon:yes gene_type:complete
MIKTYYPFELKKISSIQEYLFIIKNCFRIIKKNGIYKKIDGVLFYIFWCKFKEKFEIEFNFKINNNKKLEIQNLVFDIFKDIDYQSLFKKYHMIKNNSRILAFVYRNNSIYPLGIYRKNFYSNKKLFNLINNSDAIIEEICSLDSRIKNSKLQITLKDYIYEYNKFINFIDLENKMIFKKSTDNILSYKKYTKYTNNNIEFNSNDIFYSTIYYITIELGKYLNSMIYENTNDYVNFIIKDKLYNKILKVPYEFYCKNTIEENEENLLPPLLPLSF